MKNLKLILISSSLLFASAIFAEDSKYEAGEKLYKTNCAVCHGGTGGIDVTKRIAPPIAAVRLHYINTFSDEDSFVKAVSDWVEVQDESKSMMRGAIRKFKIMPPISIPKYDAEKIAAYIYAGNIEKPEGFEKHVQDRHGKKGKGMGKDQGMNHKQGNKHQKDMNHK